MKKSDFQQLKTKPAEMLQKELADFREKLGKLKFDLSQGKVKDIKEIKATKKTIARILTIMSNLSE